MAAGNIRLLFPILINQGSQLRMRLIFVLCAHMFIIWELFENNCGINCLSILFDHSLLPMVIKRLYFPQNWQSLFLRSVINFLTLNIGIYLNKFLTKYIYFFNLCQILHSNDKLMQPVIKFLSVIFFLLLLILITATIEIVICFVIDCRKFIIN